jgi:hypothetical protein
VTRTYHHTSRECACNMRLCNDVREVLSMRTQHECMHVPAGLDEVLCVECVCRQVRSAHALQLNILQNATKQNTMRQHDQKNTQSFAGETTPSHRRQQTFRCACASATRPTVPTVDGGCGRAETLTMAHLRPCNCTHDPKK